MPLIGAFSFFALGTIIGSFLNVVIYRLGTGKGLGGRSQCLSCGRTLGFFDLIPIISFVALSGRCRRCGTRIPPQYPLIELVSGVLFVLVYFSFAQRMATPSLEILSSFALALIIVSISLAIAAYDLRHKIIPQELSSLLIVCALITLLSRIFQGMETSFLVFFLDILAGPIFYTAFYSLSAISSGRLMGYGDSKLALAIGLALGFSSGLSAIVLSFWIGAIVGLSLLFLKRALPVLRLKEGERAVTMKTEIPFAPFLLLGWALVYFLHIDAFSLLTIL